MIGLRARVGLIALAPKPRINLPCCRYDFISGPAAGRGTSDVLHFQAMLRFCCADPGGYTASDGEPSHAPQSGNAPASSCPCTMSQPHRRGKSRSIARYSSHGLPRDAPTGPRDANEPTVVEDECRLGSEIKAFRDRRAGSGFGISVAVGQDTQGLAH